MKLPPHIIEAIDRAAREGRVTEHGRSAAVVVPAFRDEDGFRTAVERHAVSLGWRYYHTHNSRRSNPGFPDDLFLRGRRQVVAEFKMPGNRPTPEQAEWLKAFIEAKVEAYLWYPSDWGQILEVLA